MNLEKVALEIIQLAENGQVSEKEVMKISDSYNFSILEFTKLCELLSNIGITVVDDQLINIEPVYTTSKSEDEVINDMMGSFSKLSFDGKQKVYKKIKNIFENSVKEKTQLINNDDLFKDVKSFNEFCAVLENNDYNIILSKKVLTEKAFLSPVEYKKLRDGLQTLSNCLRKYKSDVLILERRTDITKKTKKALLELVEKDRKEGYICLKKIMSIFQVKQKCDKHDIDILSDKCLIIGWRDAANPKLGYVLKERGTLYLLNQIMKVLANNKKIFLVTEDIVSKSSFKK